jgi:hypothetical protein
MIMTKGNEADPIILESLFYNTQGLTTTDLSKIIYPEDVEAPDIRKHSSFIQYRLTKLIELGLVKMESDSAGRKYTLKEGAVLGESLLLVSQNGHEDDVIPLPLGKVLAIIPEEGQEPKVMFLDNS